VRGRDGERDSLAGLGAVLAVVGRERRLVGGGLALVGDRIDVVLGRQAGGRQRGDSGDEARGDGGA
jgi:hypothetical protein